VGAARRGDAARAFEFASRALALDPSSAEVLSNRGAALRALGRVDEALADYDRALALAPASADAHNNRGVALAAMARWQEARDAYDRALAINPRFDRARFNRALARLTLGDLAGGFADHEARWTGADNQSGRPRFAQPPWTGTEPLAGRTILLHGEQGMGDAIQFARYVPRVAARGARVVLQVHRPQLTLHAQHPTERVLAFDEPLPAFDTHCALMSLPLAFGTTLATIPADVPYLRADGERVARWRERLGERRAPRVGLAWSGNPAQANDRNRSMPLAALAPLAALPVTLVSLQKDVREADRAALAAIGLADPTAGHRGARGAHGHGGLGRHLRRAPRGRDGEAAARDAVPQRRLALARGTFRQPLVSNREAAAPGAPGRLGWRRRRSGAGGSRFGVECRQQQRRFDVSLRALYKCR
jgi:hypothetical protein